jgi:hypothetical protein
VRTTPARWRPPRATRRAPRPPPGRRCGRPGAPAPPGQPRRHRAPGSPGPPAGPLPAVTAPLPASPGRGCASVMSRLPMSVVPRASPGGPVTGSPTNIRDMSRNWQEEDVICHVMAREKAAAVASDGSSGFPGPEVPPGAPGASARCRGYPRGRRRCFAGPSGGPCFRETSATASAISSQGTVPLEPGLQAPGMGHGRPDLRSRCRRRRGCRPRRVCRWRGGARRRSRPGGRAGPRQSSAGCQSTGGGSEPCLMMLAYTLSSASLSGPTRPSGSPPKNRRRTRSTCPGAASS